MDVMDVIVRTMSHLRSDTRAKTAWASRLSQQEAKEKVNWPDKDEKQLYIHRLKCLRKRAAVGYRCHSVGGRIDGPAAKAAVELVRLRQEVPGPYKFEAALKVLEGLMETTGKDRLVSYAIKELLAEQEL